MLDFQDYRDLEPLAETDHSSVYRASASADGQPVVIKVLKLEGSSSAQTARLKQAYMLFSTKDEDSLVKILDILSFEDQLALVMEDFGGTSLKAYYPGSAGIKSFLEIAVRLAGLLREIHQKNIIHLNIKPSNILYNSKNERLKLTDFSAGSNIMWSLTGTKAQTMAVEKLAYISPEQTGRMNCGVDYRSDLYSLGVTFYELLTGGPPFSNRDPMELIHAHIAQEPVPPDKVNPNIPEMISNIIMRLLAKSADERYQSGLGLLSDLEDCRRQWVSDGQIEPFELGRHDISPRFNEPRLLVGRGKELGILFNAFKQNAGGNNQVVMVKGEPGIGKSSLINEMQKPIVARRGYFIAGKYDQLRQSVPFSAILQALKGLTRQLLTESDERIDQFKERLFTTLGPNGKIITDIVPEMESIIGRQPDIPELDPEAAQNRFERVLKNFLGIFSRPSHPLVLFLDDLQWVDPASSELIKALILDRELGSFLFIGAYRDREVAEHHPLTLMLDEIERRGAAPTFLELEPLNLSGINRLLANFLRCDSTRTNPLAEVFHEKTLGNPFFVIQFLKRLFEGGYLKIDRVEGWQWDTDDIKNMRVTDNVVTFMADKLFTLPPEPFELIKICACIGNRFYVETVGAISGRPFDIMLDAIDALSREGLITSSEDFCRFQHDRIQEAAYSLIPIDEKKRLHYQIGRLALKEASDEALLSQVFYIADQLNHAAGILETESERIELAKINLKAGVKAKESIAYKAAVDYLQAGINLLDQTAWNDHYALAYGLFTEQMECQYLARKFDEAERLFKIILDKAGGKVDLANAYITMLVLYTNTRPPEEAVALGISAVRLFGLKLNPQMGPLSVLPKYIEARRKLKKWSVDDILNLPLCTNEEASTLNRLLFYLATPAYFTNPNLTGYIVLTGITEVLKYGLFPHAGTTFSTMGNIVENISGDYKQGHALGQLAQKLNQRLDQQKLSGMILHIQAFFILHWNQHAKYNIPQFKKVYELSLNHGDFIYAGHSVNAKTDCRLITGTQLDTALKGNLRYKGIIDQVRDPFIIGRYKENNALIRALKGLTDDPSVLSEPDFDADAHIAKLREEKNIYGLCFTLYLKAKLNYLFGKYNEALLLVREIEENVKTLMGTLTISDYYFYYSLILAALLEKKEISNRKKARRILMKNQRKMLKWADLCPENFQHKYDLVAAELAAVDGKFDRALADYHAAIQGARKNDYVNDEALACERLALFYLRKSLLDEAGVFMNRAEKCYGYWGAEAKQQEIKTIHESLLGLQDDDFLQGRGSKEVPSKTVSTQLDLATVMEASQTISSEIVVDHLIQKIMNFSIKNAGAQRGFLILEIEGVLTIMVGDDPETDLSGKMPMPLKESEELCQSIIHYVNRTLEPVVLSNASAGGPFTEDPYIQQRLCKSLLCMPILYKGRLSGILYMENNLADNAFTDDRLDLLNMISTQAAISIENARLFEQATTDGLTKLIVHRYFQYLLDQEIGRASRYKRPFSLVMMDIDNFKNFNDTYGHQLGDVVLRQVANTIKDHVRTEDIVARYGGEEFVLVMPETEIHQALSVCEKIRSLIENLPIPYGDQVLNVTISQGVATFPHHADTKDALITSADNALYMSKRNGKNCVSAGEKTGIKSS